MLSREMSFESPYDMDPFSAMAPFRERLPLALRPDAFRTSYSPSSAYDDLYAPRVPLMRRRMHRRPSYARFFDDEDEWDTVDCDEPLALLLRKMSGMIRGRGM